MSKVPYVVSSRVGLARAFAIEHVHMTGRDWVRMTHGARKKLVDHFEQKIIEWERNGVLIQFQGDHMEKDGGAEPLVDWKNITKH